MFDPFGVASTSGWPRLIGQLKHWFRATALLAAGVFLSSCGTTVSLKDLKEYVGPPPSPSRVVAWRGKSREAGYQFQEQDVVRFSSKSDMPLTVEPLSEHYRSNYSNNRKTASLPIWVIQDAGSIKVSAGDKSVIMCVTKPSADKHCRDGKGVVDLSESKAAAIWENRIATTTDTWLKAEVIPVDPGLVLPGDEVKVGIDFDLRLGESDLGVSGNFPLPIRATSTVQSDGSISIPRLGFVSPLLKGANDSGTPANAYRAIAAATEADESRIIVWLPNDEQIPEQIPLWQIARCLNKIERHRPPPPPPPKASLPAPECLTARIDDRFNPIQEIYQWQRYTLEPGPRTWSLVDVNGRAYQVPFQYGLSVEEAVTRVYPRMTGHDLNVDSFGPGPYVTVLPSHESGEEPFYGRLESWQAMVRSDRRGSNKAASSLGQIALRARDTVIVSRGRPLTDY
jgi:hypothetical protein